MVPFSSSTLVLDNFSWRSSILAFGLDKSVWDSLPSGRLPKKWRHWSGLYLLRSSRSRLLLPERACWVRRTHPLVAIELIRVNFRSPWGPFTWLPQHRHQRQWASTTIPSLHENGKIRWSHSGTWNLLLLDDQLINLSSVPHNHRWSCLVFMVRFIFATPIETYDSNRRLA